MSNTINELKKREASALAAARESYAAMVRRVAAGQEVAADEAEEVLRLAGKSSAEFERNVEQARRVEEKRRVFVGHDMGTLGAKHLQAIEHQKRERAECKRLEEEIPRRRREAEHAVRVAENALWRARRAAEDLAEAETALDAALNGTPIPQPTKPAEPTCLVTTTPGTNPCPDPSAYNTVEGADGRVRYVPKSRTY